ncbi:Steryl-sulfatase [Apodemus speciosus]|uniref:Steryl-sulfatase n=1 Tax=Apodemus speciosus TaxID=105296 RepID=A0ABQ0FH83_APOSI
MSSCSHRSLGCDDITKGPPQPILVLPSTPLLSLSPAALLCVLQGLQLLAASLLLPPPRPNFLIIMADDLGFGDLGCYGNTSLRTPNIDRLAEDGVRLTQHLAAASICTPSRAAFLTGRYPVRSGMVSPQGPRVLQWAAGAAGLPPDEVTFARVLQERGYTTGLVGKWHLGLSCSTRSDLCHHPLRHGFGHFLGLPLGMMGDCAGAEPSEKRARLERGLRRAGQGLAAMAAIVGSMTLAWCRRWVWWAALALGMAAATLEVGSRVVGGAVARLDCFLMRGANVTQQPLRLGHVTPLLLGEAEDFLQRGRSAHRRYGDNVEEMDWVVGRLLAALERGGVANRTLVHFTSDNGGWLEARAGDEQLGGWNGGFRGGKGAGGWEGGVRVPGIFRFPGVLPRGSVLTEPTSLMDIFPTVMRLGGGVLPEDRVIDGRDLLPLLRGETPRSAHDFLFHYCGDVLHAARWVQRESGKLWKAHFVTPVEDPPGSGSCVGSPGSQDARVCECAGAGVTVHDPPLLFELTSDPGETRPLTRHKEPSFDTVLQALRLGVARHRETLGPRPSEVDGALDLWHPWLQPCCGSTCSCDLEGGAGDMDLEPQGRDFL